MKRRYPIVQHICFLVFLLFAVSCFSGELCRTASSIQLLTLEFDSGEFRMQRLSERSLPHLAGLCRQTDMEPGDLLTIMAARTGLKKVPDFGSWKPEDFVRWKRILMSGSRPGYERVNQAYAAIWNDVECMPVTAEDMAYENSWMFERNYGGKRGHEGTDLMPPENLAGHYRIVSMTDGVVEQVGWLEKGGYRIGIRSPSGGYYYYAHLDSYSRDFRVGDTVSAGMELGKMGDTGYGEEGTRGRFDVHLHLGIYIRTKEQEEMSVNPYWVLRYLDDTTE